MKIIFLNTWHSYLYDPMYKFIDEHKESTDIFCFQEVFSPTKEIGQKLLTNFIFFNYEKPLNHEEDFRQGTYIKNNLTVEDTQVLAQEELTTGLGIYSKIKNQKQIVNLINFHGISRPGDKLDSPGRLHQSDLIINFFKDLDGLKIVGGDFNLEKETDSVRMFEKAGYRNLIKEFSIASTRNHYAWKEHPQKQYFADFIFVSPKLNITNFRVLDVEISDHLPLVLEFN